MAKIEIEQLRADLNSLNEIEFSEKYPDLPLKSLKGLSIEELEQRISKARGPLPVGPVGGRGGVVR